MHLRKEFIISPDHLVIKGLIILTLSLLFLHNSNSQTSSLREMMDTTSIEKQYDYIFEKSSRYEEYKVIRETWLNQYRESLYDTVNGLRNTITENNQVIEDKNTEIQNLNDELSKVTEEKDLAIKEKNSLSFLGLKLDKTFYNLIMWIIVITLAVLLVVTYLMFKRSNLVTRDTKSEISQLQKEYDDYRNSARLPMEKVKRDHLDEIQKMKGER
jgi:hypothetical protein